MKIAVIGASGFLGMKLMSVLSKKYDVIGTYSHIKIEGLYPLDAAKEKDVQDFLVKVKPNVVIDTVALTSSTKCEQNPELCEELNYKTAKNIAQVCREINARIIFISSNYVFDGKKGDYSETDDTNPLNQYGRTKIMAEKEVLNIGNSAVIRVDVIYGYNGKGNPNGIFNWILSKKEISLREPNQIRQPVLVEDVADMIDFLINKNEKGIFHVAGATRIKMIDFLRELEKIVRNNSLIQISYEKSDTELKIPLNATMDISKITKLGIKTHSLRAGLEILKKQL